MPGPTGASGTLTVVVGTQDYVLDAPYGALVVGAGTIERETLTPEAFNTIFGPTLQSLPTRPVTFQIYFTVGTDSPTPDSAQMLPAIVKEVAARPAPEIIAIGHADKTGSRQQNEVLALRRAARAREWLKGIGVPADQIIVIGRGDREATGSPKDRRVELVIR
jgi:outer membrane protein OmpA-like peptidoglycan-associated protein